MLTYSNRIKRYVQNVIDTYIATSNKDTCGGLGRGMVAVHFLQVHNTQEGTGRNCVHMLLITACPSDMSTCINCVICELKKRMPSDSQSQTRKATR